MVLPLCLGQNSNSKDNCTHAPPKSYFQAAGKRVGSCETACRGVGPGRQRR
ncbi:hypothetical protein HMPREF0291_10036 [Corynebacterium genitalium ATCC 33030]|uniref:Uncharacterized protein n=1 Tax=Corynebacterium genitalium ATCC 33030 TaxID=585529 RepID=D7WA97_9CORY|nr:hypothetical protein HMPREF0291_10036 [Corynebacterium genitalium ATCC 33030]